MRTYFFIAASWIVTMFLFSACNNTKSVNPIFPELEPTVLLSGLGECENQRESAAAPQGNPGETQPFGSPAGVERLDKLDATVAEDGTVSFTHSGGLFNCCLDSITFEVEVLGSVIRVIEVEHCPNPCFCICEYTVYGKVVNLAPGSYKIEICGNAESTEPYCTSVVTVN